MMRLISLLPVNLRESSDLQARAEKVFGVDLTGIDLDEFAMGLQVEREHDDVTGGDMKQVAKIALAHLREVPDYYTKLKTSVEGQTKVSSVNEDDQTPSYMNVSSLQSIKANAEFLLTLINDSTPVDNWAESAIAVAAHELSQVADYMRGRQQTPTT